jgi:hypothetical protein
MEPYKPDLKQFHPAPASVGGDRGYVTQGAGLPTEVLPAPSDTAISWLYIDSLTGLAYYWNTTTQAWAAVTIA